VSGVPPLVPSRGFELGMRSELVPGLQESLSLWWLHSDSELVYVADSDIGSTVPNGAAKRVGVEWNQHYVYNRSLLLDLDLSWVRARYVDANANGGPGHEIPNAVPRVFSFAATYKPDDRLSLGWTTRYIGGYPIVQDHSLPNAPSAITTNILGQFKLTPSLTLHAEALNVFDRKFYDIEYEQNYVVNSVAGTLLANAVSNANGITVHPGEPRQFRVGLSYRY
jgi:outer membrane receptor protein involved in Fe transport